MSPHDYDGYTGDDRVTGVRPPRKCKRICNCSDNTETTPRQQKKPVFKKIGDMVYFKDIEKAVPVRAIPSDMKKRLGI